LGSESFPASWESICHLPGRQVINPLFACFCHRDLLLRWRAVTAMGLVVSRLADQNMESARVVLRRFMWNLNEESGGIGWGCPEAMGECMARSERLADEYGCILLSYLHPGRNFIEHPALQQGVLWGIGRLAHARPARMADGTELLTPFLALRRSAGLAAWACGPGRCAPDTFCWKSWRQTAHPSSSIAVSGWRRARWANWLRRRCWWTGWILWKGTLWHGMDR
jgi:hypothetical protein